MLNEQQARVVLQALGDLQAFCGFSAGAKWCIACGEEEQVNVRLLTPDDVADAPRFREERDFAFCPNDVCCGVDCPQLVYEGARALFRTLAPNEVDSHARARSDQGFDGVLADA